MALLVPGQLRSVDATEADAAQYVVIDCGTIELGEKALMLVRVRVRVGVGLGLGLGLGLGVGLGL